MAIDFKVGDVVFTTTNGYTNTRRVCKISERTEPGDLAAGFCFVDTPDGFAKQVYVALSSLCDVPEGMKLGDVCEK